MEIWKEACVKGSGTGGKPCEWRGCEVQKLGPKRGLRAPGMTSLLTSSQLSGRLQGGALQLFLAS